MRDQESRRFYFGGSMAGAFQSGDCLVLRSCLLSEIHPGDVVVFGAGEHGEGPGDIVHRIVGTAPGGLVAQGDANLRPDRVLVTEENLVGLVIALERIEKGTVRYRPVLRGGSGLSLARFRRFVKRVRSKLHLVWRPYRYLRASGWVRSFWRPEVVRLTFTSKEGPVVKYVFRGRTVACWWPSLRRFECRKPFDLVLRHPESEDGRRFPPSRPGG